MSIRKALRNPTSPVYQFPPSIRNSLRSSQIIKTHLNPPFQPKSPSILSTNLIKSCFENGLLKQARELFDEMPEKDVVAWTSMIAGYTSCNSHTAAWMMFTEMMTESTDCPNAFTLSSALKACKGMGSLPCGELVHGLALKNGIVGSIYVDNALLDMYATCCASMESACAVFREIRFKNSVSWTTLITGYTHRGDGLAGLQVFRQMFMEEAQPSPFSFSIAVRACATIGSCIYGWQIHASVIKHGFDLNIPVMNSILDMYCRLNCLQEAHLCFNTMTEKDSTTWNTLISGYEKSNPKGSLYLFTQMKSQGYSATCFTFTSVTAACANLTVLGCGQQVHGAIFKRGLEGNLPLANSLIDMYAKCGNIADSSKIFREMSGRDLVSWTSMMIAYGSHGYGKEAVELFDEMVYSGTRPDRIVFMAVLSACSHAGLVDEGLSYFKSMTSDYKIVPNQEIYGCVVDLLGRGGKVKEAYDLIENMPFEPDESVWAAFLGACKAHGLPLLGKRTARWLLDLKPKRTGIYVTLSNIYAAEGKWVDFAKMRRLIKRMGNKTEAGRSWIEVRDQIYSFVVGDKVGSHMEQVYQVLPVLIQHMLDTDCPVNVLEEET